MESIKETKTNLFQKGLIAYRIIFFLNQRSKEQPFKASVRMIAKYLQCDQSHTYTNRKRLENLGLIKLLEEEEKDKEDKRVKLYYITPKGKEIARYLSRINEIVKTLPSRDL